MGFLDAIRKRKKVEISVPDWSKAQPIPEITKILEGKRYTTLDAKLIAQGPVPGFILPQYVWLFQTNKQNFFAVYQSFALGSSTMLSLTLLPIPEINEARKVYEALNIQEVSYSQAFPGENIVDA